MSVVLFETIYKVVVYLENEKLEFSSCDRNCMEKFYTDITSCIWDGKLSYTAGRGKILDKKVFFRRCVDLLAINKVEFKTGFVIFKRNHWFSYRINSYSHIDQSQQSGSNAS